MSDVDLVAGPSKPQKRPMSPSQPAPKAKRPKKNGPKSKEVLSDTDVDESQNTPPAPKAKRPKKKSKAFLSDTDDEDRTSGKAVSLLYSFHIDHTDEWSIAHPQQSLPKIICQPPVTVVPDVIDDGKGKVSVPSALTGTQLTYSQRKRAKQTAQPDDIEDGDNSPVDKGKVSFPLALTGTHLTYSQRKRAGPRPTGPKIPKPVSKSLLVYYLLC